jgi:hypothetical protein
VMLLRWCRQVSDDPSDTVATVAQHTSALESLTP